MNVMTAMMTGAAVLAAMQGDAWAQAAEGRARPGQRPDRPGVHRDAGEMRRGDDGGHIDMLLKRLAENQAWRDELGITTNQLQEIKDGFYKLRTRQVELRARMEKAGLEQARLMAEPTVDEAAIMKAVEQAGAARTALAKLRVQQFLLLKQTLTPQQVAQLRSGMRERMQDARGRRDGPGNRTEPRRPEGGAARRQQERKAPPEE